MTLRLRSFDFRLSPYERPADKWICGYARDGQPCRLGPSRAGHCRTRFECEPVCFEDRWQCTRPISAGGRCADGPLPDGTCSCAVIPCRPERSWSSRRRMAVLWTLGLAIGLLAITLVGQGNSELVRSGPLSVHHSDIADCGACHVDISSTPAAWFAAAFRPLENGQANRGCLSCHDMGEDGQRVHGQAAVVLDQATERFVTQRKAAQTGPLDLALSSALFQLREPDTDTLSCATCHREHQGGEVDLVWIDDRRCQTCHAVKFESFSAGHPRPLDYPYQRRTRLIFDHSRHIDKHFKKESDKAPSLCETCHQPDPRGLSMQVASFDAMCADCHIGDIDGSARATGPLGVAFFSIPGLDLQSLHDRGAKIGEWPEFSEAEVPHFMWLLMAADDAVRADLASIQDVDLLDLTDASDTQIAAVERFAWHVKILLFEWLRDGSSTIEERIRTQLVADLDHRAFGRLTAALPRDVLLAMQRNYLPGLAHDVTRYRAGLPVETVVETPPALDSAEASSPLGDTEPDLLEEWSSEDDLLMESEDILSEEALDEGADEVISQIGEGAQPEPLDDLLLIEEDQPVGVSSDLTSDLTSVELEDRPNTLTLLPEDIAHWAEHGGWFRRDHTLFYRPGGHADRFLRTWLDFASKSFGTETELAGAKLFATLTHKDAPGRCTKCHSIDLEAEGWLNVKWHPAGRSEFDGSRALFSHAPHFALMTEEGCRSCHRSADTGNYLDAYKTFDPEIFQSNFKVIDLEGCAECHRAGVSGEACIQCHSYHFERPGVSSLKTKMVHEGAQ